MAVNDQHGGTATRAITVHSVSLYRGWSSNQLFKVSLYFSPIRVFLWNLFFFFFKAYIKTVKDSSTESGKLTLQNLPNLPPPSAGADLVSRVTSSAEAAVKRWKKSRKKRANPVIQEVWEGENIQPFHYSLICILNVIRLKSALFWIYKTEQSINMCSCFLQTHKTTYKLRENNLSKDVLCLFSDHVGVFAACAKTTSCFYTLHCNIWVIRDSVFTVSVGGVPLRGFSSVAKDQHGRLIWQLQNFYRTHYKSHNQIKKQI